MCAKVSKWVSLQERNADAYCITFSIDFKNKKDREGILLYLNTTGLKPHEDKSIPLCFKSLVYPDGEKSRLRHSLKWREKGNFKF